MRPVGLSLWSAGVTRAATAVVKKVLSQQQTPIKIQDLYKLVLQVPSEPLGDAAVMRTARGPSLPPNDHAIQSMRCGLRYMGLPNVLLKFVSLLQVSQAGGPSRSRQAWRDRTSAYESYPLSRGNTTTLTKHDQSSEEVGLPKIRTRHVRLEIEGPANPSEIAAGAKGYQ